MWIARDKQERLWLFIEKPIRSASSLWWEVDTQNSLLREDDCMEIEGDLFPDIRWEDEPLEVELTRKKSNERFEY